MNWCIASELLPVVPRRTKQTINNMNWNKNISFFRFDNKPLVFISGCWEGAKQRETISFLSSAIFLLSSWHWYPPRSLLSCLLLKIIVSALSKTLESCWVVMYQILPDRLIPSSLNPTNTLLVPAVYVILKIDCLFTVIRLLSIRCVSLNFIFDLAECQWQRRRYWNSAVALIIRNYFGMVYKTFVLFVSEPILPEASRANANDFSSTYRQHTALQYVKRMERRNPVWIWQALIIPLATCLRF